MRPTWFRRFLAVSGTLLLLAASTVASSAPAPANPAATRRVILRFGQTPARSRLAALERATGPVKLLHDLPVINGLAAELTPGQIRAAARLPGVLGIEEDQPVKAYLDTASQWFGAARARTDFGVDGDGDGNPTAYSAQDVVVAVVDTGIAANHPDLDGGKVIGWYDLVKRQPTPYDDNGHGTHVSSIIAGTGEGSDGRYRGVAPGAALVGVKVLNGAGQGWVSDVVAGLDWVLANQATYGIRAVNLSLGGGLCSDGTDAASLAVNRLSDVGIVVLAAAGNDGPGACSVGSPAAATGAIAVGAMMDVTPETEHYQDEWGFAPAFFSSRGPTGDGRIKPDIMAPGYEITAAYPGGSGYATLSGTSMATPFAAGTVALMLDADPSLTPAAVREILTRTAEDWGSAGPDNEYGAGRLDAWAAVGAASGTDGGPPPTVPAHTIFSGNLAGSSASHSFEVTDLSMPVSATLILPEFANYVPDFSLALYGPQGLLRTAKGPVRQEHVSVMPTETGTYQVVVTAATGSSGLYQVDLSYGGPAIATDRPPTASLTLPGGRYSTGEVTLAAVATDDVAITSLSYQVPGVAGLTPMQNCTGLGTPSASCQEVLDLSGYPEGEYTVEVITMDSAQQRSATAAVQVITDTDPAPVATLVAPAEGQAVSGLVTVTGSATDNSAVVLLGYGVDEGSFVDITANCSDPAGDSSATCSGTWDTTQLPDGHHVLTIVAADDAGQYSHSGYTAVTVDNGKPPQVDIATPYEGETVQGLVLIQVGAWDNEPVSALTYRIDDLSEQPFPDCYDLDSPMPFCSAEWDSTSVANGSHTLYVTAVASSGATGTSQITFVVGNPVDNPPTSAWRTPLAGATLSGSYSLSMLATDDKAVAGAEFAVDSSTGPWRTLTCDLPGSTQTTCRGTWNTTEVPNGAHTLYARTRDEAGQLSAVAAVQVTTRNDLAAPSVTITAPATGSSVSESVSITASATDDLSVQSVSYRIDSGAAQIMSCSGLGTASASCSATWNSRLVGNGSHTITVTATDGAGKAGSHSVAIAVDNDVTPPAVVIESPTGTTVAGLVAIQARATDNRTVAAVTYQLDGGPSRSFTSCTGLPGPEAVCTAQWDTASVGNGSHSITVTARDTYGNTVTITRWVTVQNLVLRTWQSPDLESGVWSSLGTGKNSRTTTRDYSFTPAVSGTLKAIRLTLRGPVYNNGGSSSSDPTVSVSLVRNGTAVAFGTCTPVPGAWSCSFSSTSASVLAQVAPGQTNILRVTVQQLYKQGSRTDQVDLDTVLLEVDYES